MMVPPAKQMPRGLAAAVWEYKAIFLNPALRVTVMRLIPVPAAVFWPVLHVTVIRAVHVEVGAETMPEILPEHVTAMRMVRAVREVPPLTETLLLPPERYVTGKHPARAKRYLMPGRAAWLKCPVRVWERIKTAAAA